MKISEYKSEILKKRIPELIEPSDTTYGAFCKGYRYAQEEWISDKLPEDFEDLLANPEKTRPVVIKIKYWNDVFYRIGEREKKGDSWEWNIHPDYINGVLAWKCII